MQQEVLAVGAVLLALGRSCRIDSSHIKTGDKEPSYDGNLWITSRKAGEADRSIPVQVKGTSIKLKQGKASIFPLREPDCIYKYRIEKKYLKNYYKNFGCMLFVVDVSVQPNIVYYAALTQVALHHYLKNKEAIKSKSKISVDMRILPTEVAQIEYILDLYVEAFDAFGNFEKLMVDYTGMNKVLGSRPDGAVARLIPTGSIWGNRRELKGMYYKTIEYDGRVLLLDTPVWIEMISSGLREDVKIKAGGKVFYTQAVVHDSDDTIKLVFDECVVLSSSKSNPDFNITVDIKRANVFERYLHAIRFICDVVEYGGFEITLGDEPYFHDCSSCAHPLAYYRDGYRLDYYNDVEKLFELLSIPKSIDMNAWSKQDKETIASCVDVLIRGEDCRGKQEIPTLLYDDICGYKFVLFKDTSSEGKRRVVANGAHLAVTITHTSDPDIKIPVPWYHVLEPVEDFATLMNIDYSDVYLAYVTNAQDNPYIQSMINRLYIALITAFDRGLHRKDDALHLAQRFIEWDIETYGDNRSHLNLLQVYKRQRELNSGERRQLLTMREECEIIEKVAVDLLLDNQESASFEFEKLSVDEQEQFRKWPIYVFWVESENV